MAGSVSVISDMNTHIAAATEQQSTVAHEVSQNIERISELSAESSNAMHQAQSSTQTLTNLAEELRAVVEQLDKEG